ncbi:hypothetical protein HID58_014555 [Brassica napus]|uniref:(rape) hypothetical protein n=1 Tax=Brassica napus TaxID=3708 RepID=A0A817AQV1_BRANA|nr:hypothetical protein HID58_014555 [Brassica napus]CAF2269153.1 unnamed protein product [Brassica napus]
MEVKVLVKVLVDTGIEIVVVMDTEVNTMVDVVTQAGHQAEAVMVMDTEAETVDTKMVDTKVDTMMVEVVTREEKAVVVTQKEEVVVDTVEVEDVKMENIEMVAVVEKEQRNKPKKNNKSTIKFRKKLMSNAIGHIHVWLTMNLNIL